MSTITTPIRLAKFKSERLGSRLLLTCNENGLAVSVPSEMEVVLKLLETKPHLGELLNQLHRQGFPLHLRDLSRFFEQLKACGILLAGGPTLPSPQISTHPTGDFRILKSWQASTYVGSNILFSSLVFFYLSFCFLGAFRLILDLSPFDFLNTFGSPITLPFAVWGFSWLISLMRAFCLGSLSYFALGRMPQVLLHSWKLGFLVYINPEELKSLSRLNQLLAWIVASTSPLIFFYITAATLPAPYLNFTSWISLLHCSLLLSPFRTTDLTRILNQIIPANELRHMQPFLKSKALVAFTNKKTKIQGELRLILFGSYGILWLFFLLSNCLDIMTANIGPWIMGLTGPRFEQKLQTVEILLFWFALVGYVAQEFISIIFNSIRSPLRTWEMNQRKVLSNSFKPPTTQEIAKQLKEIPFFDHFSSDALIKLASECSVCGAEKGSVLITEGDIGNKMFVLLEGEVKVSKHLPTGLTETLAILKQNSIFGEIAVLQEVHRTADVETLTNCTFLKIQRDTLNTLVLSNLTEEQSRKTIRQRIALSRALTQSIYFRDIPHELTNLFFNKTSVFVNPPKDSLIISEGQEGHEFYIVVEGSVVVKKQNKFINKLELGQFFGEIALLENHKRTADVIAGEDCLILKIPDFIFFEMLAQNWGLALNIDVIAAMREEREVLAA